METAPKKINAQAARLISKIGLDVSSAVWLKLTKVAGFTPERLHCVLNCMIQKKNHGGELIFGWILWQNNTTRFCEAEFHCVWKDNTGRLRDITPRVDGEKRICFIPDPHRDARLDTMVQPPIVHSFINVRMTGNDLLNEVQRCRIVLTKTVLLDHLI